jgi:hypothetical protein
MFDGTLPEDDGEPATHSGTVQSAWPWAFIAFLLVLTSLAILAGVLFPDVLASPVDRF